MTANVKNMAHMKKKSIAQRIKEEISTNGILYLMFLPGFLYYFIFAYVPMYGVLMAFQNYEPLNGIWGSEWVGLMHFKDFLTNYYFLKILKNTLVISINCIIFAFPAPIIMALLVNEIKNSVFKKTVQTITYIPHFISLIVICGLIHNFVAEDGLISDFVSIFTGTKENLLNNPACFVPIYVISDIWQGVGWGSIIYLAALLSIDTSLYEAATIDGAGKFKQVIHVTIPGIMPTIIIMFILRMGGILGVGYEKIILLYNPLIYDTADVISTFTYRKGLIDLSWSYSSAVGLFNSVISIIFVTVTNAISRKLSETSLW
mgnify:FL=1